MFEGEMGGLPSVGLSAPRPFRDSGKGSRKDDDESTLILPARKASRGACPDQEQTNSRKVVKLSVARERGFSRREFSRGEFSRGEFSRVSSQLSESSTRTHRKTRCGENPDTSPTQPTNTRTAVGSL